MSPVTERLTCCEDIVGCMLHDGYQLAIRLHILVAFGSGGEARAIADGILGDLREVARLVKEERERRDEADHSAGEIPQTHPPGR